MSSVPPTLIALALILGTALLSAAAVGTLARPPQTAALALPTPAATLRALVTPLPATVTGPLDGQTTPRAAAERPPIAVLVDNAAEARPQAGLGAASVVYEAPVEAGITRLLAVLLEHDAATLGPVRSARPYFLDWAAPYHPLFVHDGGSPQAQRLVGTIRGLSDVEAGRAGTAFHRVATDYPPHNLFTATTAIRTLARLHGLPAVATVPPLLHTREPVSTARPTVGSVTIRFAAAGLVPSPDYTVDYRYDPASHAYLRSVGGAPSVDSASGKQIRVANVVVLITSVRPIPNDPLGRVSIRTSGTGNALVFQDGSEVHGHWSKAGRDAQVRLTDLSGVRVGLIPGSTWIEVTVPGLVHAS